MAASAHDYLRLAPMYFELGNYDQTQIYLDKAQSSHQFGHHPERDLQIRLWQKTGQGKRAIQDQWCYFQKHHRFDDYQLLLKLAEQESDRTDWAAKTIEFLQNQLKKDKTGTGKTTNMYGWMDRIHS